MLALLRDETGSIRRRAALALVALSAAGAGALVYAKLAHAAVTVTPANATASADTSQGAAGAAWQSLGNIVIAENANGDFTSPQTNTTLVLNAPSGWQFQTGAGSVTFTTSRNITAASIAVVAATATVTLSVSGTNRSDTMTISGLKVQPTAGTPLATGNITASGTATITGITGATNFGTLTETVGAATKLGVTTQPAGATAGAAFTTQPAVAIQDQFGNTVTSDTSTVAVALNSGTGPLQGTLTKAAVSGVATFANLRLDDASDAKTLRFTDGALTLADASSFNVTPAAASKLVVTTQPSGATAGSVFSTQPVVKVEDAYNNVVTSDTSTVTVALNSGTGPLQGTTSKAAVAGVATFTNLRIDDASDAKTLRFTDGALTLADASSFNVTPAAASKLVVTTQPAGATAGSVFSTQPVVKVEDAYNNVVTSDTSTVTVALNAGTGPLQGTTSKAAVAGVATFTNLRLDDASDAKTLRFTDGALTLADASSFNVTPAAASKLVVTTQPAGATAGSVFATQPVVKVEDAYNNVVTSDTSTVTVALNAGTGPLQGTTSKAAVAGVATFTNLRIDDASDAKTLRFTDGALTAANANSFNVSPAAASQLAVTTQPGSATAGSAFGTQPVVKVQDAYGNTITGDTSTVTVALNSGTGPLQGTTSKAAVAGVATFTNLRLDDASDAKTLRFTDGALTAANANAFNVSPAAASQLAVTTQPGSATAGSAFATQPVVKIQDAYGNTVTSDTSTVTVALNSGTGPLQGTLTKAAVAGVAAFTNLRLDDASDAKVLRFTDGALTAVNANAFNVSPAAASKLVVTTQPSGATAGSVLSTQPVVKVEDAYNNVITGDTSTVTVSLGAGTGPLQGTLSKAAVAGVATFTNLRVDDASDAKVLHFVDGALTAADASSFTVSPAAASQLAVTTQPGGATAGSAFATQPVVKIQDAYGNTITGDTSTVSVALNSGTGPLQGTTSKAAVAGVATFTNLRLDDASDAKTLRFTDGALTAVNANSFNVSPAAASKLVVTTQPAGATAGAAFSTQPVVKVEDAYNNVVTSDTSTVTVSLGSGTGPLQGTLSKAAVAGVAAFTNLRLDSAADAKTLHFVDGALTAADSSSFTVSPGALAGFAFALAGPQTNGVAFAGGNTLTAQDAYGNTVTSFSAFGDNVTISPNGALSSGSISGLSGVNKLTLNADFVSGVANLTTLGLTYTGVSGSGTFTATSASGKTGTSGAITVNAGAATHLGLTGTPASVTAGSAGSVTVTALDVSNNTATGYTGTVRFTSTDGQAVLPADSTFVAGDNGAKTFSNAYTLKTAGGRTLTATDTVAGTITGTSGAIAVNPAAAATLSVTAGATQTAGSSFAATVTAKDAYNNTATGYTGTVHVTSGDPQAALPADYTFLAGDNGTKNLTVTLKSAGTRTVTATDTVTGSITGTSAGIMVNPGAASQLAVTTQPGSATAGSAFGTQPVVTVQDAYGNTVTSDTSTVTASLGSGTGPLQGTLSKAAVNGVATFTDLRIDKSGAKTLHFADGALTAVDAASFTVSPASASALAVTTQPAGATAGSAFGTQPVVAVQDAYGNTVTSDTSTVTVSLGSGTGPLQGTLSKAAVAGVTTFTNLRLDTTADAKTLHFVDGALTAADSGSFAVSPAAAAKLVVATQPAGAAAGSVLSTQPVVRVEDAYDNVVTSDTSTVTVALNSGTGPLQGTLTKAAVAGVATFTNLRLDDASDAKVLRFTDGALTAVNANAFNVSPAAASKLVVTTQPSGATAGSVLSTQPVVKVEDAYNNVITGDTSTVTVSLGAGTGPLQGTLSKAAVAGVATFTNLRLDDASDAKVLHFVDGALTAADASSFTVTPAAASQLAVTNAPASIAAGGAAGVRVTARDAFGNTAPGYTGTVVFSSDDPAASLPANYTFVAGDGGVHDFAGAATVTLKTAGSRHVTATDSSLASPSASSSAIAVTPAAADHFVWSGVPATATAGAAFSATLTLQDAYGNTATGYTGTVDFASTDGQAVLPANYTYVAGDNGAHAFGFTLKTVAGGAKTITAHDASLPVANRSLATGGISVTSASALTFTIADSGSGSATAGAGDQLTITAHDQFGNVADGYAGDHDLTFSGGSVSPNGTAPTVTDKSGNPIAFGAATTITFANGVSTNGGSLTLTKAVGQTITAAANGPSVTTPSGLAVSVAAAAPASLELTDARAGSVAAGQSDQLTVTAKDDFGNVATGYTGDHDLTFAGGQASPNATAATVTSKTGSAVAFGGATTITFANGVSTAGGAMTLPRVGSQSITASASSPSLTTASALAVNVGTAAAAGLAVSNAPASVTAGGAAPVRITALDTFGNTATGYTGTVVFSSDDPAASLPANYTFVAGDGGVHDFAGAATVTLKTAGSRHVTATDSSLASPSASSSAIAVGAAAADHFTWAGVPGTAAAGAAFGLTLRVEDAYGNAATGYTGTVGFSSTDPQAALPGGYTFTGGDAGVHAFASAFTLKTAGARTITASDGTLASLATSGIAVAPAAASTLALPTQPGAATAGSPFGTQPVVEVRDAYGNVVTGDSSTVTATIVVGGGTLQGTTSVGAVGGVATFTDLRVDVAGSKQLRFADGSLATASSSAFSVAPAAANHFSVSAAGPQTAGAPFTATITALDAFGNIAAGYTGTAHFSSDDAQATVPGDYAFQPADAGTKDVLFTLKTAGSRSIDATDGPITGSRSVTVDPAAATRVALTGSVADLGSGSGRLFTATVEDAYGNAVTSDGSTSVTLAPSAGPGTLTGGGSATVSGGSTSRTLTGVVAGSATVTASAAGLTSSSLTLAVVPGPAATLALAGSGQVASGGTHTLTATVQDAAGNTVTGNTSGVTFTRTAGPGTASNLPTTVSAVAGVASLTVTNQLVGSITVEATDGALTSASTGWAVVPGAAAKLSLAESGSTASGGTHTLTATVQDAAGNTVTGDGSSVTFAKTGGAGTATGFGSAAAVNGVATLGVTNVLAGPIAVTATDGALTQSSAGWTIGHGPAAKLVVTGSTADLAAGSNRGLTATVQDAAGNTVSDDNSTIVDWAQTAGSGAVAGLGTVTASSGAASATVSGTTAGSVTITASSGSLTSDSTTFAVVAGPVDAGQSRVLASPGSALADGVGSSTLTVTLKDAYGNAVGGATVTPTQGVGGSIVAPASRSTNGSGVATFTLTDTTPESVTYQVAGVTQTATVAFTTGPLDHLVLAPAGASVAAGASQGYAAEGFDAANHDLGDLTASTVFTISPNGSCTGSTCSANLPGTHTVTGTNSGKTGQTTLTVTPGTASLTASTFTGAPASIVANGSSTATVTLHLKDGLGNDLGAPDGSTIAFTTDLGGVGATTNNGDGTYTATLTSGTAAGTAHVSATRNGSGFSQSFAVALTPGPVSAGISTASASPPGVVADGAATATITVTLKDANGNTVSGKAVSLGQGGGSSTISPASQATNGSGVATFTVESTTAETVTYTATDATDSITLTRQPAVTFTPGAVSAAQSTVAASPASVVADGVATSTVTVTLKDANGNRVPGKTVSLGQGGGSSTIAPASQATDGAGQAVFTVADAVAQPVTYTATDTTDSTTVTQTATVTFLAGAASPATSTLAAAPATIIADGAATATVTVRLKDALGNDLTGSGGTVSLATTRGTLSAVTDNGDGTYTATLTASTSAGTATVSGTVNGSPLAATATVGVVAGPVTHFTLGAASPQTAGAAFDVAVTAKDANGNTVTGYAGSVHFTSTDTAATLPADYTFVPADSGTHTFSVTLKTAGSRTVTVTQGANTGTSGAIAVDPAAVAAGTSTVGASPASVTANGTQSTVTVTLKDQFGNAVPGKSVSLVPGSGSSANPDSPRTTDAAGAAAFRVSDLVAESVSYSAVDTTDSTTVTQTATVAFTPGPLDHVTIAPTSSTVVAGNGRVYTVQAFDAQNNLIGDVSSSAALGIVPAPSGTSCTGATCTSNTVGSYTVTASYGGKTASGTLTVDPAAASLAQSTITTDAANLEVGPTHTTLVRVTLRDQFGNPAGASGGPVDLATTAGSLSAVTDNLDGTYTATLTAGTLTGVASVTGDLGGPASPFASSASVTFTPGAATHLSLVPSATSVGAGNAFTVAVTALDQYGNVDTNYAHTVHFTASGSASLPANTTLPGGAKTVSVTLSSAGLRTVTATDTTASSVDGTTPSITVAAGGVSAAQSTVAASPGSVVHDGSTSSTITVTLKDAYGNPLQGKAVTLDQGAGSSSITTVVGTTDAAGQARFTATDTTVEPVTYTATGDGVTIAQTATVTFTSGALDHIVVTPASATISAGATQAYRVEGYDASNVDLGDLTGSSTFELDGASCGGSVCGSTAAGTHTITARNSGTSDTATLAVTPASASTATSLVSAPASATASNPGGGVTVTVALRDAFGNALTSGGDAVAIQSSLGTVGAVTDHGDGTYSAPLSSTGAGVAAVTASLGASSLASSTTVTFAPGPAATLDLTAPGTTTAGSAITVTATLRDQFGNVATGYTGTVAFTSSDPQATLPAGYTFTPADAGTRSFSVTLKTYQAQTVHAADGPIAGTTGTVVVSPDSVSATTSTLSVGPGGGVPADGTTAATATATLTDAYGNPLQGKNVQILLGGSAVPSSTYGVTDSAGRITFTLVDSTVETVTVSAIDLTDAFSLSGSSIDFLAGTADSLQVSPGTQTIQAGAGQLYTVRAYDRWSHYLGNVATSSAITVDGTPCPGAVCSPTAVGSHSVLVSYSGLSAGPFNLTVTHGPLTGITISGPSGTVGIGASSTFTSTGRDAYGNTWNDTGSTAFTIAPDGTCSGNVCQPTAAGDHTVTGTDGSFSDSTTLRVTGSGGGGGGGAGVVDPALSTIGVSVGTVAPDGTTATVTVTLRDGTGAAVSGKVVTLHTSPAGKVGDAAADTTDSQGRARFTVSDATATPPETVTYSADDTTDGIALSSTASIVYSSGGGGGPGPVDAARSSIVAAPASVTADGSSTTTITVTLADASGVAIAGKPVTVTSSGAAVVSAPATTDTAGVATFTATDATAETATFATTVDGVTLTSGAVTFTAPVAADTTPPTAIAATAADGGTTITISFDEPLGGSVGANDFTVAGTAGGNDPVNGASVTPGSTSVTVTVDNALDATDAYTVTFNGTSLADQAATPNAAQPFALAVTLGGGSSGSGSSGSGATPAPAAKPPAPAPPPAAFGGVTPGDGQRLFFLDKIVLRATTVARWSNVTVTPDGGAAQAFPDQDVATYELPFAPPGAGGYTIHATMTDTRYDGFTPVEVSSHFDYGPAAPPPPPPPPPPGTGIGGPNQPGSVVAADGSARVDWDGGTFTDPVTITVRPVSDGAGAANGGHAVEVVAQRADGSQVHALAGVMEIQFAGAPADAIPATSEDNVVWSPLPALSSHALAGSAAGFFRDDQGTVHVLTSHLTYFGLLRAPAAKLAFRVVASVQHVLGRQSSVAARLQSTRAAKVTGTLFGPDGKRATTWKLDVRAGTSVVQLRWPEKVTATGAYTITFSASSGGQVAARAIRVQVVRPGAAAPRRGPLSVVISGPSVDGLGAGLAGVHVVQAAGDDTFAAAGAQGANVSLVVVDVDQYGLSTIRDLHALFPDVRLVAVSSDSRLLGRAVVLGATVAVPASTPSQQLAALIGRLARRPRA